MSPILAASWPTIPVRTTSSSQGRKTHRCPGGLGKRWKSHIQASWFMMWHELNTFLILLNPTNEQKQIIKLMLTEYAFKKKKRCKMTLLSCLATWHAGLTEKQGTVSWLWLWAWLTETAASPCRGIRLLLTLPSGLPNPCWGVCVCYSCARNTLPTDSFRLFTWNPGTKCRIFSNQSCLIHALWIWRNRLRKGKCLLQDTQ